MSCRLLTFLDHFFISHGHIFNVGTFMHRCLYCAQILVHIGALSDKSGFKLAENADHGGPLGELVQWSDLIATLHILGHRISFSTEISKLRQMLPPPPSKVSKLGGCPTGLERRYDAIFIDIVGLKQFRTAVKNQLQHYQ